MLRSDLVDVGVFLPGVSAKGYGLEACDDVDVDVDADVDGLGGVESNV